MIKSLGDRYVLLKQIATGGMSSGVWEAIDSQDPNSKRVAVKLLEADKDLRRLNSLSFETEVEAYSRLNHKHVLRIFDHGTTADSQRYIVMEWMPVDLERYRDERPDRFSNWDTFASEIAFPVLEALAHCHSQGVAHRDIKPANILISETGSPIVADFGLSKLRYLLQPRQTLGTFASPPFTPPETDDGSYTYSRDVYAFAATCVWALSGSLPSTHAELHQALNGIAVPDQVRGELQSCLAKDPTIRPETAAVAVERFSAIQNRTLAARNQTNRKKVAVRLTDYAQKQLQQLMGLTSGMPVGPVKAFLNDDLNDSPVIERRIRDFGKPTQNVVPGAYQICGGTYLYELTVPASTATNTQMFLVTAVNEVRETTLSAKRENCLRLPIDFCVDGAPGCLAATDVEELFEEWLFEFEAEQRRVSDETKKHEMLVLWENLLNAQEKWEMRRFGVIKYTLLESRGVLIRIDTGLSDVSLPIDSSWYLRGSERSISCRLLEQNGTILTLNTHRPVSPDREGTLERSSSDFRKVISRQRSAINAVAANATASRRLPEILLNPGSCSPPEITFVDDPYSNALNAALNSKELFFVTGPPGTGKTTLIKETVENYLTTHPEHKVLICAQTNVAIDNALERIGESTAFSAVRVGGFRNSGSSSVSRFHLDNQMRDWEDKIEVNTTDWRRQKAVETGVEAKDIELGSLLLKISNGRGEHTEAIQQLKSQQQQRKILKQDITQYAPVGSIDERPRALEGLEENIEVLEDRLSRVTQELSLDEKRVRQLTSKLDADMYLAMTVEELREWADDYILRTPQAAHAFQLLKLQAEWFERLSEKHDSLFTAYCDTCSIVAATCIGLESLPGGQDIEFDLCILDEASKASPGESLVPLVRSKRSVLVGDIKQLPPYQSDFLRDVELMEELQIPSDYRPISLFEQLLEAVPQTCTETLNLQRRMVPEIGDVVSQVFYQGKLQSDQKRTHPRLLQIFKTPVVWTSTSRLPLCSEETIGRSIINHAENDIVLDLIVETISTMADVNLSVEYPKGFKILVLSGYSEQVKLIQRSLQSIQRPPEITIEITTIDAVQGREAEVVLFSLTRSNDLISEGFLKEEPRINVAISRAKEVLCIVGDAEFIDRTKGNTPLKEVLRYMRYNPASCSFRNIEV